MAARAEELRRENPSWVIGLLLVVSVGIHLGVFALLEGAERPVVGPASQPMELVVIEVQPEAPPPPKVEEPPPPPPKPIEVARPRPKVVKPPPIEVAETTRPPPPEEDAPPPPNDAPPAETPPKPAPLVVGISMSSTTANGSFAAATGNTLHGKTAERAVDPKEVKAYSAPRYVPVYQADSSPEVLGQPNLKYPAEARRHGIEGVVKLKLTIDYTGKVVAAKLLSGLGYGLDEAALEAVKKFRWKPAYKGGEAVSTEITYAYRFLLD